MERNIISKQYITMHEARRILEERLKDAENPLEIHNKTRDYLLIFGRLEPDASKSAVESLLKLNIPLELAVNIIDICPQTEGEVRLILSASKEATYDPEIVSNILSIVKKTCS